ncbi:hypothetical protein HN51_018167 [Arachis hypogaea]
MSSLLLVMLLLLCCVSMRTSDAKNCSSLWCGKHNIKHPFRLQNSSVHCGDHSDSETEPYQYLLYKVNGDRLMVMKQMIYVRCINDTFYVNFDGKSLWELGLRDSCYVEWMYPTSLPHDEECKIKNISCRDNRNMLLYGFELSWAVSSCNRYFRDQVEIDDHNNIHRSYGFNLSPNASPSTISRESSANPTPSSQSSLSSSSKTNQTSDTPPSPSVPVTFPPTPSLLSPPDSPPISTPSSSTLLPPRKAQNFFKNLNF